MYYAYSRTAFKIGILSLNLSGESEILVPNYICEEILYPLYNLNIIPVFYKIFDDFSPDWNDIRNNLSTKTKAIIAVHYFGQPQNLEKFQKFCSNRKIFLIEDNAHGWGSKYNDKFLGTIGNIGFSSPRKILNIKTGGILYIKNKKFDNYNNLPTTINFLNFWMYTSKIKRYIKQNKYLLHLLKNQPKYWDINGFKENEIIDKFIDNYSLKIIKNSNLSQIISKRRKIYSIWEKFITSKTNFVPVYKSLKLDASPLVFPAYTNSFKQTKLVYNWGWNNAIDIKSWPSLPNKFKTNKTVVDRWQKLVCFPIENDFNIKSFKRKLDTLKVDFNKTK